MSAVIEEKKREKVVTHFTTLDFDTETNLLEALAHFGVDPRDVTETVEVYDELDNEVLTPNQIRIMKKHGIPYREETLQKLYFSYEGDKRIRDRFGLKTTPSCNGRTIRIETTDMTASQHKSEVRKILRPVRWAGFKCRYKCETSSNSKYC